MDWGEVAEKPLKKKARKAVVGFELLPGAYRPQLVDVQNLLLRVFTSEYGENPKWACVRGMNNVRSAVVFLLPCLDTEVLRANREATPNLTRLMTSAGARRMRSAGEIEWFADKRESSVGNRALRILLGAKAKPAVSWRKSSVTASQSPAPTRPPLKVYLASADERARSGYPTQSQAGSGWVTTATNEDPKQRLDEVHAATPGLDPDRSNLFGLDCEMVTTASGPALVRISLVDVDGSVVLDQLVRPEEEITDYLTEFTGITADSLKGVETSLADVQTRLLQIVSKDSILVGHSLENDLIAMKLVHERVIDTVLLYPHPRGWPVRHGLKGLSGNFLKRKLERKNGHDSVEDARTAMDLALLKFEKGPGFGTTAGESVPLGRLLRSAGTCLSVTDRAAPDCHARMSWCLEDCRVEAAFTKCAGETAEETDGTRTGSVATSPREVHFVVCRELEDRVQDVTGEDLPLCLARVDQQVCQVLSGLSEKDLFVFLTGFGADRKSQNGVDKGTSRPEIGPETGGITGAFGVFTIGGSGAACQPVEPSRQPVVVSAPPPQRELVTYDV